MASTEVELKTGLTTKSLALTIPLALLFAYLTGVLGLYTDKGATFGTFLLPMIYLVIVMELLGRVSPKLKPTPQEYVFMFAVFSFLGLHSYLTMHAAGHNNPLSYPVYGALSDYVAFQTGGLEQYWSDSVPAAIIAPEPLRFDIGRMFVQGRAAGEAIPWGPVITAIVYWGLVYIFYAFISMFVTFTMGKVWIEEERLSFPLAVPSIYLFREVGEVGPSGRTRLFDFKVASVKVFWGLFVIGMISGIVPLVAELWPAFPAGAWWGETKVDMPFLAAALPGAYASFIFLVPQVAVGLVMPNDVLISLILGWVIFGVLYQAIGVNMGIVPYTAGMEFAWPWETYPGTSMPFPYRLMATNGVAMGVIIMVIFTQRKRIAQVFSTLWKGDIKERGLSLRILPIMLLIGAFGWYGLMLVEGADPIIALMLPMWALLWNFFYGRVYAEVFWHVGTGMGYSWSLTYMTGQALRGWPSVSQVTWDTPVTDPAWMTINRHISNTDHWNIAFGPLSSGCMVTIYKLAYELRMRLRDLLIAFIIGMVILLFVFVPIDIDMVFHTQGGSTTIGLMNWWPWVAAGRYHRGYWVPSGLTQEYELGVLWGLGIAVSLVLYVLKFRVPFLWFINVPALYVAITIPTYMWMTSLLALIIKFVVIRTIGIKKYEEYVMPMVAGWILGFGAMWLPPALMNMFGVAIPRMQSLFIP